MNALPAHLLTRTIRATLELHFDLVESQIDELAASVDMDSQAPALLLEEGGRGTQTGRENAAFRNALLGWNKALGFLARAKPENVERLTAQAATARAAVVSALLAARCPARA